MQRFMFVLVVSVFVLAAITPIASAQTDGATPSAKSAVKPGATARYAPTDFTTAWMTLSGIMTGLAVLLGLALAVQLIGHGELWILGWMFVFMIAMFPTDIYGGPQGQWDFLHGTGAIMVGMIAPYLGMLAEERMRESTSQSRHRPTSLLLLSI